MSKNRSRWLFLTAAFGSEEYDDAAHRLVSQAEELKLFDKLHIAGLQDLMQICPRELSVLPQENLTSSCKFGYYFWKPIIISAAIEGFWGEYEGVVYIDAGSEILPGLISQIFFAYHMRSASKKGINVFAVKTPEISYTKKEVLQFFNLGEEFLHHNQFQAGTIFVAGPIGREICFLWREIIRLNPALISPQTNLPQFSDFIAHRHDQSVLSCLLKKVGISKSMWMPGGILKSPLQQVRNLHRGLWWSRNISRQSSILPLLYLVLSRTTLSPQLTAFLKPYKKF